MIESNNRCCEMIESNKDVVKRSNQIKMWHEIEIQRNQLYVWFFLKVRSKILGFSYQNSNFILCQSLIEEDQFVNMYTCVELVTVCILSSNNNPTVSMWWGMVQPVCATRHLVSIDEHPDSFTSTRSDVVQYKVSPTSYCWARCLKIYIPKMDTEPERQ